MLSVSVWLYLSQQSFELNANISMPHNAHVGLMSGWINVKYVQHLTWTCY